MAEKEKKTSEKVEKKEKPAKAAVVSEKAKPAKAKTPKTEEVTPEVVKEKPTKTQKVAKGEKSEVKKEEKVTKVKEEKVAKVKEEKPKKVTESAPEVKKEVKKTTVNVNRLKQRYTEVVIPALMKEFNYDSIMETPKIEKVVINMGVGDAAGNSKLLEEAIKDLAAITGQKPIATKAKKSIASFKLRENSAIGCKVTLRGDRMYEFIDKLFAISLPRVRDFRGVSKSSFDGRGNYTLGIKEQLIFPEIKYENVVKVRGMDITIVTTAKSDKEAFALLLQLGMPFQK